MKLPPLRSLAFLLAGVFLMLAGFLYDVVFAGIPYQDPAPELAARYRFHSVIASAIRWAGLALFLLGGLRGILRMLLRRFISSRAPDKAP